MRRKKPDKPPDRGIVFADGTRIGDSIPGSKFVRSMCERCREPIRVRQASYLDVCLDCGRSGHADRTDDGRRSDHEYHGDWMRLDT